RIRFSSCMEIKISLSRTGTVEGFPKIRFPELGFWISSPLSLIPPIIVLFPALSSFRFLPSAISRVQYKVLLAEEPNGNPSVSEILKTGRFPKKAGRKKFASTGEVEPITVNGLAHSQRLRSSKRKKSTRET